MCCLQTVTCVLSSCRRDAREMVERTVRRKPSLPKTKSRQTPDPALDVQQASVTQDLELLANVDSLAPARSALVGLHLRSNSFRHFPNGSSIPDVLACPVLPCYLRGCL
jgi:hypothetical protein